jgi:hypothetical protein
MRTAGFWLMLVCATSLSGAQEAIEGDAAAAIRALEHDWVDGQSSNDNRALDLIFDNGLVYVEYGTLITKGEYLSRVKAAEAGPSPIAMGAMSVRTFGGTAIVVGTYREKIGSGSKTHLKRWRFVDTWVFKRGRWMLVAAAAAPSPK